MKTTITNRHNRATEYRVTVRTICTGILILACQCCVFGSEKPDAPKVANVHFSLDHGQVLVNYDLLGEDDVTYWVELELRNDNDSAYRFIPRVVSGDVGLGKFAGRDRKIQWAIDQEFPLGLPDSSYYFIVHARSVKENSGSNALLIIGTGAALVTAATTYFLVSGTHQKVAQAVGLPAPPGRP